MYMVSTRGTWCNILDAINILNRGPSRGISTAANPGSRALLQRRDAWTKRAAQAQSHMCHVWLCSNTPNHETHKQQTYTATSLSN